MSIRPAGLTVGRACNFGSVTTDSRYALTNLLRGLITLEQNRVMKNQHVLVAMARVW